MSIFKKIVSILTIIATTFGLKTSAQVQVSVATKQPLSGVARDYIEQGSNITITVKNITPIIQKVKIFHSINNVNNGDISIGIKPGFQFQSISLLPWQIKVLSVKDLFLQSGFDIKDIEFKGLSKDSYLNNETLPEGLYSFCAKYVANGQETFNTACTNFLISSNPPPIVLNPVHNSTVKPLTPQNVVFNWTPTGKAGTTRYNLEIVDLNITPVNNPNDAFENNVLPFFKQSNIITNSLVYGNNNPALTEGHKYAVRVTAIDPQKKLLFKNNGQSQVITFVYKKEFGINGNPQVNNDPNPNNPQPDPLPGACNAGTLYSQSIGKQQKDNLPDGSTVAVGLFLMKNTKFSKRVGSYDGTGEILVNFLHTKIKVEFLGIKINGEGRMFDGKIFATVNNNQIINESMSKIKDGVIETIPNISQLLSLINNTKRKVPNLSPENAATDLPVNFPKDDFNMAFVGLIFEPTEAYANTIMNLPISQLPSNEYALLQSKGIRIHPNGYGGTDLKIGLAKNKLLNVSDKLSLEINAGLDKTYATFDCNGIKEVKVSGSVVINRNTLLPLDKNYKVINDPSVKVSVPFSFKTQNNFDNFIIEGLTISHPFTIPGMVDFVINPVELGIDFSAVKNIGNFLPNNTSWNGVYIKDLKFRLPEYFQNEDKKSVELAFNNIYIGRDGLTGNFAFENFPIVSGDLGGFGYTLTKIGLSVNKNIIEGGLLKGTLKLPLGDKAEVGISGTISKGNSSNKTANIGFGVTTMDEIDANLFLAKIKLYQNSEINFTKNDDEELEVSTNLFGNIGINFTKKPGNSNVSKFELPNIDFEGLIIKHEKNKTTPYISFTSIGLQAINNVQAKVGSFELNLKDLNFKTKDNSIGLQTDLNISLFGGDNENQSGAGGGTKFTIWAKYNGKTFKYDKATLDAININADLAAAKVEGGIEIFDEDEIYGNGFRGNVNATLRGLGASVGVTLQFGKTLASKGNFKYWYFDAMADFGKMGLNIPGTVASLYGFGGGAWCNMQRSGSNEALMPNQFTSVNNDNDAAPTSSGSTFTPQKGKAGFFAAVMFGLTGSKTAFNGDLKFTMDMDAAKLSVNHVKLEGNAYLMQDPTNIQKRSQDAAFLHCNALIEYDGPTNKLTGNFGAHLNIKKIIEGGGEVSFMFDMPDKNAYGKQINPNEKTKWFIKVGQWTPGIDPFEDNSRVHAKIGFDASVVKAEIKFQSYFMVGNALPSTLPPMPEYIYNLVKYEGINDKSKAMPPAVYDEQNLAFAFGAGLKLTAGFDFFVIKADLEAAAGFDVLLANVNGKCGSKPIGFDGWYAQGQAYAYLKGDMKLFRKISLAEFVAGAVMQVKMPNPNWISGDIVAYIDVLGIDAGEYHGHFEKGELCDNLKTDEFDPFNNIKLIKNVAPSDKAKAVDPYTNMEVTFAYDYGNNGSGSVIHSYDAFNNKMINYQFQGVIYLKDKKGKKVVVTAVRSESNPRIVKITPKEILQENSEYTIEVFAKAVNDNYNGKTNGKEEHLSIKFSTGSYPAKISMNDIGDAYPLPYQRYAMKNDNDGKIIKGRLDIKRDMTYFVDKYKKDYNLVIRFKESGTNAITDVKYDQFSNNPELLKQENSLIYTLPTNLKKGAIYHLSIVLKPKNNNGNDINVQNINMGLKEQIIFDGYPFKMSKYNSLKEKFADYKVKKVGYITSNAYYNTSQFNMAGEFDDNTINYDIPVLLLEGKENLDIFEYAGYSANAKQTAMNNGKIWYGNDNSDWMKSNRSLYADLLTDKITGAEKNYLNSLGDYSVSGTTLYVKYNSFIPSGTESEIIFAGNKSVFFMQNPQWFITELREKKSLTQSEGLAHADGLLTKAEVEEAFNGKAGIGLQNNSKAINEGYNKVYWPLVDFTLYKAVFSKVALDQQRLLKSSSNNLWKTWNLNKKLGWPSYSSGKHTLSLYMNNWDNGMQTPFANFEYNYKNIINTNAKSIGIKN